MDGFPVMHLAEEVAQSSGDSRDSSLAVSPLSTHRTNCESLASTGADSAKPAMSTLFAKVDVSDLLAPLEARLFERLDSVEAMLERRCGAVECRVGVLTAAAAASSDTAGFQQQIKVLQAQMEATMGSLQSYMEKESVRISNLTEGLRTCGDRQASLQSSIDEVWRQLKADRQEVLTNYQNLSDTIEPRLRGILDKVDRRCTDLGGLLTDDIAGKPAGKADAGGGPLLSPAAPLGRLLLSPPTGYRQLGEDERQGRFSSAPSPTHAAGTPAMPVPASPQLQHRSIGPAQPSSPGLQAAGPSAAEAERLSRHASAPMLPMRMRSADAPSGTPGCATPSACGSMVARPAQALQRGPVQRMASGSRPHLSPELGRGGGLRSPPSGGAVVRALKELPRP